MIRFTPLNKVAIRRDRLPKEDWDWLRNKIGFPDDNRPVIFLIEPSVSLDALRARMNAKKENALLPEKQVDI